jgi:hypothetical protein
MVAGMRIGDHFLFHHTSDAEHDAVLHSASVIAVMMLAAAVAVLGVAAIRRRDEQTFDGRKRAVVSIAVLVAVIGVLLTPLSAGVWRVAPEMAFLQFPWRLTAVLAAAVCGMVPLAVGTVRVRPVTLGAGALVVVAAMGWPAAHQYRQQCDDEDTVTARLGVFVTKAGTDATDEYTPGEADNDALGHANPPFWLAESGDGMAPQGNAGPVPMHFTVEPDRAEMLVLNLRAYPAWVVRVNGAEVKDRDERADGLIALPVRAGRSRIDIAYRTTEDRRVGDGISLLALCGAFAAGVTGRRRSRPRAVGRV